MRRGLWIDAGLGLLLVALGAATSVVSAVESASYGAYLFALGSAVALAGLAQTARAFAANRRHEREIADLRAGQEYLAQPESTRMMNMLVEHHAGLQAADERFREHFDYDATDSAATSVTCNLCGWQETDTLADVRPAALAHLDAVHAESLPPRRRWHVLSRN